MRTGWLVLCGILVSMVSAFGQQRGMYGGVSTGQMVGTINGAGFASGLGATVSGLPQTGRQIPLVGGHGIYSNPYVNGGNRWGGRGARTTVVPYGAPWGYVGGFGGGYDMAAPDVVVQPVQQQPSVIINQYYSPEVVRPELREYTNLPPSQQSRERVERREQASVVTPSPEVSDAATKATVTLLAFKDSSVTAVIAYWVKDDVLHYVTKGFKKMLAPVGNLDRVTTEQLNRERKVEFTLE